MATEAPIEPFEVLLIAPNVSEKMGGEAIKAFHISRELARQGVSVHQITHERVRSELTGSLPQLRVTYISDTLIEKLLYRAKLFELALNFIFLRAASKKARQLLQQNPNAVVHFTSPISPVLPYPRIPGAHVVIGPNNGNIYFPPAFYHWENPVDKIRRLLHPVIQFFHRFGPSGKRHADAILVAGGERTYASLRMAGCRTAQFVDSSDSGVLDAFAEEPRITHSGQNLRFFHSGRLLKLKGTSLILRSLTQTKLPIELDIMGLGPELNNLRALVTELHLEHRVHFRGWVAHSDLTPMMRHYRGLVFPSLTEANGMVVQESMILGLPVIAVDWGGPSLLVTPETGILISPSSEEHVITELAAAMDTLAADGDLAEQMSIHAREQALAKGFLWSDIIRGWRKLYASISTPRQ